MGTSKFATDENHLACCFSATCAVGRALQNNWATLLQATRNSDYDWYSLLNYLNSGCVAQFDLLPAAPNFAAYTSHVRKSLRSVQDGFLSDRPQVQSVLHLVADSIVDWKDDSDLEDHLNSLNKTGFDLATFCVSKWGGPRAKARLDSLSPLALELIQNHQTGVTYTYCMSSGGPVFLAFGKPNGALLSYLNLEFYFFHEYLSHIFPRWDDRAREFSEGYLFSVAHWSSVAFSPTASKVVVWNHDFAQHASTIGAPSGQESRWERIRATAEWYKARLSNIFPHLLLELATYHDPANPNFGRQFIRYLYWIADSNETIQNNSLNLIKSFSGDLKVLWEGLRDATTGTL